MTSIVNLSSLSSKYSSSWINSLSSERCDSPTKLLDRCDSPGLCFQFVRWLSLLYILLIVSEIWILGQWERLTLWVGRMVLVFKYFSQGGWSWNIQQEFHTWRKTLTGRRGIQLDLTSKQGCVFVLTDGTSKIKSFNFLQSLLQTLALPIYHVILRNIVQF